jgi:hypothetical protein
MAHYHPEDRPDPSEQPIRARVPDHVAAGAFSTGVIVMTAQTEFILDFVQNLGRPHQIIARVVMPHHVLPQLVDALQRNIELYKNRWGELPHTGQPKPPGHEGERPAGPSLENGPSAAPQTPPEHLNTMATGSSRPAGEQSSSSSPMGGGGSGGGGGGSQSAFEHRPTGSDGGGDQASSSPKPANSGGGGNPITRQASVQEIYDDLKVRDEILSGAYANAVMIGHGPHEFSFDFITNFYPHSAVSARVFLAAGQIPRLFESLKGTWEQMRTRMQQPPTDRQPPQPPTSFSDEDNPFA